MERIILHSDCNSFYASVECLHRPEIRRLPVAVGGDVAQRHGIILAKNQLAKRCGVQTGEALWQAKQKCADLVIVPPRYDLYLRFSRLAQQIYLDYTDQVEPFGLDEAWLDVTGSRCIKGDGKTIAQEIRRRVKQELGITVSIGVSFNKVFAKLGSDYQKPDAVTAIGRENYRKIAWPLPVRDLLYVGPATEQRLRRYGVRTIGALAALPIQTLRAEFGKVGEILWAFANGYDASPVERYDNQPTVKSVGNSTTAPRDLCNNEDVKIVLLVLAGSVCRRLREQGFQGKTVHINVRDNRLLSFTKQISLHRYTNLTEEIARAAYRLFAASYHWRFPVRSVGISVSSLTGDSAATQTSLFESPQRLERQQRLNSAVDSIKSRFGSYAVQPALLLKDPTLSHFDPKQEHIIHPVGYF